MAPCCFFASLKHHRPPAVECLHHHLTTPLPYPCCHPAETLANMEALERMFGLSNEDGLAPAQQQKVAAAAGKQR